MKKMTSATTFFRKQLGYKGQSQHNGRGVVVMDIDDDVTAAEVEMKIRACLDRWLDKNMVEEIQEDEYGLRITLKASLFETGSWHESYRCLAFGKKTGHVGVVMVFKEFA